MHTQRQKVLALLKQARMAGISSYDFTYKYQVKQCPTRIFELKQLGYSIVTRKRNSREIDYILIGESPTIKKSQATNITTQSVNSWDIPMESYIKDGKTYWREVKEPVQEVLI